MNSTYCIPNSNTGGWKCKGLPFSPEYREELEGGGKEEEDKSKRLHMNLITFKMLSIRGKYTVII